MHAAGFVYDILVNLTADKRLFTGRCLGTSRVTWLMIAGSSPMPEPDDCVLPTLEHWPSVAQSTFGDRTFTAAATWTVIMDNLGVH